MQLAAHSSSSRVLYRPPCVREPDPLYEDEGSTREAHGAVSVGRGAWWSAVLATPIDPSWGGTVVLRLERHGDDAPGARGAREALLVAGDELDAIVTLLAGVVAQARRDGVLPPPDAPDR